jgi:hypothetical protein
MSEEKKAGGSYNIEKGELSQYVSEVIEGVEKGLREKYCLKDSIDFELAVVHIQGASGGIRMLIVDAAAKYSQDTISKIKFSVVKKGEEVTVDFV